MDYQQEPRQFFGGSMIQMPMADFVKEHNNLIHILRHGSKGERAAEAASQEKELRRRAARRGRGIALSSDEEESSDEENIEGGGNSLGRMIDDSGDCFRSMYEDAVAPFYTAQQYRDRVRRLNRNIKRKLKERQKDEIKALFDVVRGYYNHIGRPLTPRQYAIGVLDLYYKHVDKFRNMGPFSEAKFIDEVRRLAEEADADPSAPVAPLPSAPIPAWAMGDIDQNPSGVSLPGAVEENDIQVPTITEPDAVGSGIASSKRSAKVAPITEEKEDRGIGVGDVTLLTLKEKVDAAKKAFRAKQAAEKAAKKKSKRGVLRKLMSFLPQR
jgi:hypothetical protein